MYKFVPIISRNVKVKLHNHTFAQAKRFATSATDPYKVLGIERDATETTVKNAYIRMSKTFHPDRNPGNEEAKQKFINVQNAYRSIMEKFAASFEGDEKEKAMPYAFTISPLGIENEPQPTFQDRLASFILVGIFIISLMLLFSSKTLDPLYESIGERVREAMKPDKETLVKMIHQRTLREDAEIEKVEKSGEELNQIWDKYKINFSNRKS
uniref:Uncharacterized LOC100175116 n=1 Tax=Ciona intestinalis TaxID=7719 RepID=F6WMR5_CIOIN|nr:uncharacterized protein LOC100175116 isoform X2 [Ciona intestinalis]|eukprot:XP_009861604.1 uncharacterized protein LOC100175116 isoform X2 [Ciona intestinalis]